MCVFIEIEEQFKNLDYAWVKMKFKNSGNVINLCTAAFSCILNKRYSMFIYF